MLLIDLEGTELTLEDSELLLHPKVFGIILFTRNYHSIKQLQSLTKAIKTLRSDLFIAVDQEGGRVQRFRENFTILPAMQSFGEQYEKNPDLAKSRLQQTIRIMVEELQSVGVDFSLVPVLDINHDLSEIIGERSFHSNPNIVIELARIVIETMRQGGMPATGKHFPGHGGVVLDSHLSLPVDERSKQVLWETDLKPFAMLSQELDAIMPAHVVYPAVDSNPVGFSSIWLQTILRQQLKFNGVIISDDLSMAGAAAMGDYVTRAEKALSAGCDLLIICNNRKGVIEVLEATRGHTNANSQQRIRMRFQLQRKE